MNRTRHALALLVLGAAGALAQQAGPTPTAEVGMNFSLLNLHPGSGSPSFTASGGSGTIVYNFNRVLGAVADLGSYHNPTDANFNPTTFTYLF